MTERKTQRTAHAMRKSARRRVLGGMIALAAAATRAEAQPAGEGPLILRTPSSARILGVGGIGVVSSDGDAMLYNPGRLSNSRGFAASMQRYGGNGTAGAMATTTTSGANTLGIGVQFLTFGAPAGASYASVVKNGTTHLSDAGSVAATSTALTFGIARTLFGQRLGANVKYVEDHVGSAHDGTVALDLGYSRTLWNGNLGVAAQNLGVGPRIDGIKGRLPSRLTVGYGISRAVSPTWDIGGQMGVSLEGAWFVRPAGGVEISYVPIDGFFITLRNGFRLPRERDESLVTAGLSVTLDSYSLDYAMEPMRGGRPVSHRLGIRLR